MRRVTAIALGLVAAALMGCAQAGMFAAGNMTSVELSEPNYRIVATGVSGQAEAAYMIGVSYSNGPMTQSFSLARVSGTGHLYKEAMEELWATFEAKHGPIAERHLALANAGTRNFLIYNDVSLTIRADIIEFVE